MRRNLEDDLTRTFRAAALAAPDAEPEFSATVAARRRRHARTRIAGMAAVVTAVVAVTAGVAVTGLPGFRHAGPAQSLGAIQVPIGSLPTVDLSVAEPYRDVWPDAVVELPYPLPDGRTYSVEAALDADSYLLRPWVDGVPALPVVLDAVTGAVRELGTVPTSGYTTYDEAGGGVTEHHIVWVVAAQETGGARYREVWSAPRDGGAAVRRARFGPDHTMTVTVAEVGGAFYAGVGPVGQGVGMVYRIPDGGEPQQVTGSDGYDLRYGPWALPYPVGPVDVAELTRPAAPPEVPTFWNVATGERRTPRTLDGVTMIECTPLVCLGRTADSFVSYGADGSRPLRATGVAVEPAGTDDAVRSLRSDTSVLFDSTGRFVQIRQSPSGDVHLWDREANTVGRQQENEGAMGDGLIDLGQSGGKQRLLNLKRIH
ncbi:hypothetical protein I0C86_04230 [Plantactinospora sp. S1510]|uniref:Uncharacterized protein n=1 Tax=Plantactinospora alkalitolerans TaxID=2789879 RepID=A0ABS0GQ77_9ACTN|nr:hypothetical protein [Plantactinospora alkalitolerans]MBF9128204.1 hypothetical protein [Plantactinospora alkalitolerans]